MPTVLSAETPFKSGQIRAEKKDGLARKDSSFRRRTNEEPHGTITTRTLTDGDLEDFHEVMDEKDLMVLERMRLEDTETESVESVDLTAPPPREDRRHSAWLPYEIICHIISFISPKDQGTLCSAVQVSRLWYSAGIHLIYTAPRLDTKNYVQFVQTICPSVTNIKPSPLSHFVRELDLGYVDDTKRSLLPRLLRRVCGHLTTLVVPRGPFGLMTYQALSHCTELRLLDLSNISHSMNPNDFLDSLKDLKKLEAFKFPRSAFLNKEGQAMKIVYHEWPDTLQRLFVSGSVPETFFAQVKLPPRLHELAISHCPFSPLQSIFRLVHRAAPQLTTLTINAPLPRLSHDAMNQLLTFCPNLENLCVAVDYITPDMFSPANCPYGHPLTWLDLNTSGVAGTEVKLKPDALFIPIAEQRFPRLRTVAFSYMLKWTERYETEVDDLVMVLKSRAEELEREMKAKKEDTSVLKMAGLWEFAECRSSRDWGRTGARRIR